ncbi:uncharacterized protein LOC114247058 [Bombyx mandarina]|uniref:Uncharacterized protein LOC114247058 n=1 Tax=Bombyx mandarina TaxID=7092 RepID=A0A6J2K1B6_BOMMA|nr:uncharacterized protein LOC114247058 [Bombyx mandarina]
MSRSSGSGRERSVQNADAPRALHARSFKLRFAAQREVGRSYVSLVKPLGLPATVTDKFYSRPQGGELQEESALSRIDNMFALGPRDKYQEPSTSAQEYGWWCSEPCKGDAVLQHHIRDSAWLKERLRVLAADDKLKLK